MGDSSSMGPVRLWSRSPFLGPLGRTSASPSPSREHSRRRHVSRSVKCSTIPTDVFFSMKPAHPTSCHQSGEGTRRGRTLDDAPDGLLELGRPVGPDAGGVLGDAGEAVGGEDGEGVRVGDPRVRRLAPHHVHPRSLSTSTSDVRGDEGAEGERERDLSALLVGLLLVDVRRLGPHGVVEAEVEADLAPLPPRALVYLPLLANASL